MPFCRFFAVLTSTKKLPDTYFFLDCFAWRRHEMNEQVSYWKDHYGFVVSDLIQGGAVRRVYFGDVTDYDSPSAVCLGSLTMATPAIIIIYSRNSSKLERTHYVWNRDLIPWSHSLNVKNQMTREYWRNHAWICCPISLAKWCHQEYQPSWAIRRPFEQLLICCGILVVLTILTLLAIIVRFFFEFWYAKVIAP